MPEHSGSMAKNRAQSGSTSDANRRRCCWPWRPRVAGEPMDQLAPRPGTSKVRLCPASVRTIPTSAPRSPTTPSCSSQTRPICSDLRRRSPVAPSGSVSTRAPPRHPGTGERADSRPAQASGSVQPDRSAHALSARERPAQAGTVAVQGACAAAIATCPTRHVVARSPQPDRERGVRQSDPRA